MYEASIFLHTRNPVRVPYIKTLLISGPQINHFVKETSEEINYPSLQTALYCNPLINGNNKGLS